MRKIDSSMRTSKCSDINLGLLRERIKLNNESRTNKTLKKGQQALSLQEATENVNTNN